MGGGNKLQRNLVKGKDRGEDKNKVKFDKLLFGEILLLVTYCITTNHLLSFQQVNQTIIYYKEFPLKQSHIKLQSCSNN